tara:strand:- start:355 stop:591 length:237 start_codon:yes stop_codon:yes gene_type:complete
MKDFQNRVMTAMIQQADAMIQKHKINIDVMTRNASGVADHPDIMKSVEEELDRIGHWEEIKSVVKKHFEHSDRMHLAE